MALAAVQVGDTGISGIRSGTAAAVIPAAATIGNCVVVMIQISGPSPGVVDAVSSPIGAFEFVGRLTGTSGNQEWWACLDVTGAANTITVTTANGPLAPWFAQGTEWSGGVASATIGPQQTGTSAVATVSLPVPVSGVALMVSALASGAFTSGPSSPWVNYNTGGFSFANGTPVSRQVTTVTATQTANYPLAASHPWQCLGLVLAHIAPAAPTLTSPANASYQDVSSGLAFSGVYNASGADNMGQYAMRIKVSTGSYNYWNAGSSSLQSTIVWNTDSVVPGGSFGPTLPSTAIFDGNVYNWSLASQDASFGGQGPFASDYTFTAEAVPTLTVTAPTGTVGTTTQPTVAWTPGFPAGASQVTYQIIVESGGYGTVPGSGVQVWASGIVVSSAVTAQIGTPLVSGTTYRVFVQVTETGGLASAWAYSTFTLLVDVPASPLITATASTDSNGCPIVLITVQGRDNYLTANDSSFEGSGSGSVGSWVAVTNCALSASNTVALDGLWSLKITPSAAGAVSLTSGFYPVTALGSSEFTASLMAGLAARSMTLTAQWYDGATNIGSTVIQTATDSTSAWTQLAQAGVVAPATTTQVKFQITYTATGTTDVHYVDEAGLFPQSSGAWTLGGFVGLTTAVILRSDGVYVRYASPANPLAIPSVGQTATVYDYEAVPGVAYTYTAVIQVASIPVTSLPNTPGASVTVTVTGWWELNPTAGAPTSNPSAVNANMIGWTPTQTEQATANPVLNQTVMNIVANAMMHQDFSGTVELFSAVVYAAFNALLVSQQIVFISSPWGSLDSGYFRIGPESGGQSAGSGTTAKNTTLMPSTSDAPHRTVAITAVAQQRPPV